MKAIVMTAAGGLALLSAGCGSAGNTEAADAIECATTLAASGIGDPAAIPALALATPACTRLAGDVLQNIIDSATKKAMAQRRAMGLAR